MIFTVSLIILIVFTLPLAELTIKDTLDVSDALNAKSDLTKLSQAIKQVYGEGQGSKQTINIYSPQSIKLDINYNYVSFNLKLKDNSNKYIKVDSKSNLQKTSIPLSKGENIITVEWPVDSENMEIYKK